MIEMYRKVKASTSGLDDDAFLFSEFVQNGFSTSFVNGAQSGSRKTQAHPTVFLGDVNAFSLEVGVKFTLGFIVGVRNVITRNGLLTSDYTNSCHDDCIKKVENKTWFSILRVQNCELCPDFPKLFRYFSSDWAKSKEITFFVRSNPCVCPDFLPVICQLWACWQPPSACGYFRSPCR